MSLLNRIAALVSVSTLFAMPAFAHGNGVPAYANAQHASYGWGYRPKPPVRSITLAFDELEARVKRNGDLVVRYKVQPQSLQFAYRVGVTPMLQVRVGNKLFQARITDKNGKLAFELDRRVDPRQVVISVVGANGRYRIDNVVLHGRVASRVAVQVDDRHPDRYSDRGRGRGNRDNRGNRG